MSKESLNRYSTILFGSDQGTHSGPLRVRPGRCSARPGLGSAGRAQPLLPTPSPEESHGRGSRLHPPAAWPWTIPATRPWACPRPASAPGPDSPAAPPRTKAPRCPNAPVSRTAPAPPCPVCAAQGLQSALRHDPEYNLYACTRCPEAWYLGQRELFAAYAETLAEMARDIAAAQPSPPGLNRPTPTPGHPPDRRTP